MPELFHYLKMSVDQNRSYGNFVLTGSSQFKFIKHITESLAGRIGLLSLLPFQYQEMPKDCQHDSVFKGSYPKLVLRHYWESDLWYSAYIETYINIDVRLLSEIGNLLDFQRFIQLLAANATQLLDYSFYARDIGVSVPTIKRWLSILEAYYIIFIVPPYYENLGKRIIKSPKIYFYDTGIISYYTGITTYEHCVKGPIWNNG